jgi:hypothetical protein
LEAWAFIQSTLIHRTKTDYIRNAGKWRRALWLKLTIGVDELARRAVAFRRAGVWRKRQADHMAIAGIVSPFVSQLFV